MNWLARICAVGCASVFLSVLTFAGGTGVAAAATPLGVGVGVGDVSLLQSSYTAHENQGYLTITILRTGDLLGTEHVGYGVKQQDARDGIDFNAIPNTMITMAPGEVLHTFQVRIIDMGINATPVHALVYLYTAWPAPKGANTNAPVTILHDDPLQPRDVSNPLGVPAPSNGNLLAGAKLYVDPASPSAQAKQHYARSKPGWAAMLGRIASAPGAHRFWMWNLGPNVQGQVAHYLQNTQITEPGTTVMLSSYNLVHDVCGSTATPAVQSRYDNYMDQTAAGIGNFHVVYLLEIDSLITTPCLSPAQLAIRLAELRYAVTALERDPHVLVYIDAGAADAVPAARIARLLSGAGIAQAQGFFLNATHFDWTQTELTYGRDISRRLGGSHFIINTGESGRGPLVPANRVRNGNEVLCNPPGRGLGPLSVNRQTAVQTGYPGADGFLWFDNPGNSGGQCVPGAPPTAQFWPAYAVMLAQNWVNHVTGPGATTTHKRRHR
ncbi:MAG: glycoside hydrolase family 6 protein [Solirubrobacteraceae bacterium]